MKKRERVELALNGQAVDRPPVSAWYHFGLQYGGGDLLARAALGFYRAYDWDFIKVMNDYSFPSPEGCEAVCTRSDWEHLGAKSADTLWPEQLRALDIIRREAGEEVPILETIFSPWTAARRAAGASHLLQTCRETPELALDAMQRITERISEHIRAAAEIGIDGIFLSLGAATSAVLSAQEYARFCRPFDLQILDAAQPLWFNVLHVHGTDIHFNLTLDYPAHVWNWSHRHTSPSLAEGRTKLGRPVMGGIDEQEFSRSSPQDIQTQIAETIRECGRTELILAPGCSVPTDSPHRNLLALARSVKKLAEI